MKRKKQKTNKRKKVETPKKLRQTENGEGDER
jgi:hypothetical protein